MHSCTIIRLDYYASNVIYCIIIPTSIYSTRARHTVCSTVEQYTISVTIQEDDDFSIDNKIGLFFSRAQYHPCYAHSEVTLLLMY